MFNEAKIKECLFGLAQFSQSADPNYPVLDSRLTTSITGRSISQVHPLLSVETLYNIAPEFDQYIYPAFDTGIDIFKGKIYEHEGTLYAALVDIKAISNIIAPPFSAFFVVTNPFSAWLYEISSQSAIELATLLLQNKKLAMMTKSLLESMRLYEGGGLYTEREIGRGRFVGFEIEVVPNENILIEINSIGMQVDSELTNFRIYLYHSSQPEPIAIAIVEVTGGLSFGWTTVAGFNLKNLDLTKYDNGGVFYLGYYELDFGSVQAISKRMNIGKRPCMGCDKYNHQAYSTWSKRMMLNSISVDSDYLNPDKTLFDANKVNYHNDRNFGLNFAISIKCDVSEFFCKHKVLFADAYAKLVGVNLMKQIAYSTRINFIPELTRAGAAGELDPTKGSGSLLSDFNKALQAVDYDFSGFDRDCLPCSTRSSVTYGAI